MALRLQIDARPQTINDVFVVVDFNATARAATGAHAGLFFQEPDALFVEKILAAQGANRAEIDHVARELVFERLAREDVDLGMVAAIDDLQLRRARYFARETHAPRAHDAAVGEQGNLVADSRLVGGRVLFVDHPAFGATVTVAEVLQTAFPRLVADR